MNTVQIYSFDVFDTVLTRVVGAPKAVFLLLGKHLANQFLINCTPEAFAYARINAEQRTYGNVGEKCSLDDIYKELATALRLSNEQREKIMYLECEMESQLLRPIPMARDLIQDARNQGKQVVFVSDMYLPAEFIKEQLVRHSFWVEGDELYVSHEYGKSKATGQLFQEVISRHGVSPAQISHCGNDWRVDVQGAKKAGLQARHFNAGNLNKYEKLLESHSSPTEGLSSVFAGASRLVRLQIPASSPKEEALRDVAAGVVAPTLVGFVLWVLYRARVMGLKRLYFVSRDGQVLLEIASRLASKLKISCELRYVYGSRLAWNMPALASLDRESALQMLKRSSWVLDGTSDVSIRDFFARVSIAPEEISEILAAVGFKPEDWGRMLNPVEQQALHPVLENSKVIELIFQKAHQKQQVLMKYLEQEKLLDPTPQGLVDVGWFGSSYDSLCALLNAKGATLDVGLFFGLRSHSKDKQDSSKVGYFFDERTKTGLSSALSDFGFVPLEVFCCADHGTVTSFTDEGEEVRPVFKEECNQKLVNWGLPLVREAIYCFTENLLLDPSLINPWADTREASAETLKSFWLDPSHMEARAWGDFPWEKGHSDKTDPLAQDFSWVDVVKSFLTTRLVDSPGVWLSGAIARSPSRISKAMRSFLRYRSLLSKLKSKVFKQ